MSAIEKMLSKIDVHSKKGITYYTAATIFLMICIFSHVFFYSFTEDLVKSSVIFLAIAAICTAAIEIILFSYDPLYNSKSQNAYVTTFRMYWPSLYFSKKYNISEDKAKFIWFSIFNEWESPSHPKHSDWKRTLKRGFWCRYIIYMYYISSFLIFASISIALIQLLLVYEFKVDLTFGKGYGNKVLFIIGMLLWVFLLKKVNNPDPENMTGALKNYAEANKMNIEYAENIFAQKIKSL